MLRNLVRLSMPVRYNVFQMSHWRYSSIAVIQEQNPTQTNHVLAWTRPSATASKASGIISLPSSVYASPIRADIMHQAVVYERGQERGIQYRNQKGRGDMNYSRRKVRPQKRTGAARLSDRGSPTMRKGGRAFPRKSKDHRIKINQKLYEFALRSALSTKYAQNQLTILDTDIITNTLTADNMNQQFPLQEYPGRILYLAADDNADEGLSTYKLSDRTLTITQSSNVRVMDILRHDHVVLSQLTATELGKRLLKL